MAVGLAIRRERRAVALATFAFSMVASAVSNRCFRGPHTVDLSAVPLAAVSLPTVALSVVALRAVPHAAVACNVVYTCGTNQLCFPCRDLASRCDNLVPSCVICIERRGTGAGRRNDMKEKRREKGERLRGEGEERRETRNERGKREREKREGG